MESRAEIRTELERVRAATEALLEPLTDEELVEQVSPLQSPLVWDFAHVAHFEELWLLRTLLDAPPLAEAHDDVYDAFRHERATRGKLPLLQPRAARAYAADVRARVLDNLEHIDLDAPNALLRNGFVYGLVAQHELQHQETMLQTLQLRTAREYPTHAPPEHDVAPAGPDEIEVPGGAFRLGAVSEPWAYDNELPGQEVELEPFRIDRAPVTNAQFAKFVERGGYGSRRHWSTQGWEWRRSERVSAPLYWKKTKGDWTRVRFGRTEPLPPDEPVQHVSWYEADAFARWAGKRLPTELEWERAAAWDERRGKLRFPWGESWMGFEANLDRRAYGPVPVGSFSGGVSPVGCVQMAGDVWEWTSSHFRPYPGFLAFPYPEYSEVFFGDAYRVLRGGSWATDSAVARTSFRNWDYPVRRQIFAGFRCARDG